MSPMLDGSCKTDREGREMGGARNHPTLFQVVRDTEIHLNR